MKKKQMTKKKSIVVRNSNDWVCTACGWVNSGFVPKCKKCGNKRA